MRTAAIVAEYNPFHNGHLYHIKKTKSELSADYVIVVMSGNYVQRGEPAIIHKWKRTEMCLKNGADIVIELPVYYSTASADYFAQAAVTIIDKSNIADFISFGAETGRLDDLKAIADFVYCESADYKNALKTALANGSSFPSAKASALMQSGIDAKTFETPNNILAIEYLKSLKILNSHILPHSVKRQGAEHNSTALDGEFSSASAIRKHILSDGICSVKHSLPEQSYTTMLNSQDVFPIDIDKYSDMLAYKIKTVSASELAHIFDVSEGLENRIIEASCFDIISSIIAQIKTKRYTFTKIQRILLHILLGITTGDINLFKERGGPQYIRVLGFNRRASEVIKKLTEKSELPVIMNLKKDMKGLDETALKMLYKEIETTEIYFCKVKNQELRKKGVEFSMPLIIL